jgi:hypothetical protein
MSVTPSASLAGVLPVVISGNRPLLSHRCTSRLLAPLRGVTADPVWLVREDRAASYQRDGHEIVTFPVEEAEAFAAAHWLGPGAYQHGGFLGCFTEREWACRVAAERGYWAVLQLDDNIHHLRAFVGYGASARAVKRHGGMALFADLLAALTLSTNGRMVGARLASVNPRPEAEVFARAGFPYSLYLERVDLPDREPYYGPIEEDILHAYQYGARPDEGTAGVLMPLSYTKEHVVSARTGMRPHYDNQRRCAGLQMVAPEMARATIMSRHSNGRGSPRVFHQMAKGAIRTPLVVKDAVLFEDVRSYCTELRSEIAPLLHADVVRRVGRRAHKAETVARLLAGAR